MHKCRVWSCVHPRRSLQHQRDQVLLLVMQSHSQHFSRCSLVRQSLCRSFCVEHDLHRQHRDELWRRRVCVRKMPFPQHLVVCLPRQPSTARRSNWRCPQAFSCCWWVGHPNVPVCQHRTLWDRRVFRRHVWFGTDGTELCRVYKQKQVAACLRFQE
ncbi:hypothetical protein BLNAU_14079 [Blattamonas nauphoetae]|uniref:Uncharacterized protein n=1 Tax=Blattamonas nauphoetae TaxID=2049346 RepID=A0ABQ9XG84_9EUKA|nr:hypothetical protein BLNAU_14079 [Blattamonas nauphoetae]